eukprot:TRINITY_DN107715_c0_g1_i1.p1 TRINITY_DN107715_c0_g1~~TRINITY_DN107715_c0_g1_i1.p1  ORF type:complete len:973 (-),score=130.31 TRINITY_DN107715_c0_g1_i1:13-2931(-)
MARKIATQRQWRVLLALSCLVLYPCSWPSNFLSRRAEIPPRASNDDFYELSQGKVVLLGLLMTVVWELFCTRIDQNPPTILSTFSVLLGWGTDELPQNVSRHQAAAALLNRKMDEYSATSRRARRTVRMPTSTHLDSGMEDSAQWEVEDAASGPLDLVLKPGCSVLFFAQHSIIVMANEKQVDILLFRVGNLEEELVVRWGTMDGTAQAGIGFKAAQGITLFEQGATTASLSVFLLPTDLYVTPSFFVVHIEGIDGEAVLGSLNFLRVCLTSAGPWPTGLTDMSLLDTVDGNHSIAGSVSRVRLVRAFAKTLLHMRGKRAWNMAFSICWLNFHHVVLNTLLLSYALYDFCLTRANDPASYKRLPIIVAVKLVLVFFDRFADHVKETQMGGLGCTLLIQQQLIHKFLQMPNDGIDPGHFFHLLLDTVPDTVTFGYKPVYQVLHGILALVLSAIMAMLMPLLRGGSVSLRDEQHLFHILFFAILVFALALWVRRKRFNELVVAGRDSHIETNEALFDLLACRHWIRSYDVAYPSQHVRTVFDQASTNFLRTKAKFGLYKHDTQWLVRYLGETAKILGILYGGYATLDQSRTGIGDMSLGRFAVFVSLYGIIIDALYFLIEAWDGLHYAAILIRELSEIFNQRDERSCQCTRETEISVPSDGPLALRLESVALDLAKAADPCGVTAEIPLGRIYGVMSPSDLTGIRCHLGALLGGVTVPGSGRVEIPGCVRTLLLCPPVNIASGSVLENLLSNAAAWVRASDALGIAHALGIAFPAPDGVQPRHAKLGIDLARAFSMPAGGHLAELSEADVESWAKSCRSFQDRMSAMGMTVMSPMSSVKALLQPAEIALLDLARGLLADPEVFVVQDLLAGLAVGSSRQALHVLAAWQRLGGLRGLVCAWEAAASGDGIKTLGEQTGASYPAWLSHAGSICRTLIVSESTLVATGISLRTTIDDWLVVGADALELTAARGDAHA